MAAKRVRRDLLEVALEYFETNSPGPGQLDLITTSSFTHDDVLFALIELLLSGLIADDRPAFTRVRVVLPLAVDLEVPGIARTTLAEDAGVPRVCFVRLADRELESLLTAINRAEPGEAVLCPFLELYALGDHTPSLSPRTVTQNLVGETIRHHLEQDLQHKAFAIIGGAIRGQLQTDTSLYILCLTGSPLTLSAEVTAHFDAAAFFGVSDPGMPVAMQHLDRFVARAREMATPSEILKEICASGATDNEGEQILAHALAAAERPVEAFEAFSRSEAGSSNHAAGYLAMGARLALDAGKRTVAANYVTRVLDDPRAPPAALRACVAVARHRDDSDLHLRAASLLWERMPTDPVGQLAIADQWLRRGRPQDALDVLTPRIANLDDDGRYLLSLARYRLGILSSQTFLNEVPSSLTQRAIADCIWEAARRQHWDAVQPLLAAALDNDVYTPEVVRAGGECILAWCSRSRPDDDTDAPPSAQEDRAAHNTTLDPGLPPPLGWLSSLTRLTSSIPGDADRRGDFDKLFGAEALTQSAAMIACLPLVREPCVARRDNAAPDIRAGTGDEQDDFAAFFREHFRPHGVVLLVPERMSIAIEEPFAMRLLRGGLGMLDFALGQGSLREEDLETAFLFLKLMLDVAETAFGMRTPRGAATAIALLHVGVSSLGMRGMHQQARDVAEGALLIAGGTRDRGVHCDAWLLLAEARARGNQPLEALLALALASRCLTDDGVRLCRYFGLAVRVLRNLQALDDARFALDRLHQVESIHPGTINRDMLKGLSWSLMIFRAGSAPLGALPEDVRTGLAIVVREAFEEGGRVAVPRDRAVAASYLVAASIMLEEGGCELPIARTHIEERLASVRAEGFPHLHGLLQVTAPTIEHIRDSLASSTARYSGDTVQDAMLARVIAHRALASSTTDLATRVVALEVSADLEAAFEEDGDAGDVEVLLAATTRAFERARAGKPLNGLLPILMSTRAPEGRLPRVRSAINDPPSFVARLSRIGAGGTLIESSAVVEGKIGHLRVHNGGLRWAVEASSNAARLGAYEDRYPFGYHEMDARSLNPHGEILDTLRGLGVAELPAGVQLRVVAPTTQLIAIPANLQPVGTYFAGDLVATCQVPSLSWIVEARESPLPTPPWDASAWVLKEKPSTTTIEPLTIVGDGLERDLAPLGVAVHRNATFGEVRPTPATWIVCHGALGLDQRHFARVANDRGEQQTPAALLRACDGAILVVLLVCSGGRGSRDTFGGRVRGLPAVLLRSGVRCVVASPWPLDVLVGLKWSVEFATRLRAGMNVAEAAFASNLTMTDRHPKDRLAMHVFGDPWLCFRRD